MVNSPARGCLEPEVIAAYVDHGLSLTERLRVDTHLASCPRCVALLAGVARTTAELSTQMPDTDMTMEAPPSVRRRVWVGALGAAAAVIVIVLAPSLARSWVDDGTGLVSLVDSVGEHRSVLGRLTGGFPHAPLDGPSAGGQDGQAAGTDRVLLTAGRIRESFGERTTPSQLHALGVAQLLAGRHDDAALSLLAAAREQPANARYLNDVATLQLERARLGLRPDDLPRALAAADRARRLDPSLHEAWFNHALAMNALSLRDQARASWMEYLRRDRSSAWASEARAHLEALNQPTPAQAWAALEARLHQSIDAATADQAVRTHTTEARQLIENALLPAWANAVLSGAGAHAELERVRTMAESMLRVAGDALYRDAVAVIDAATARSQLTSLAQAHASYAQGAALFTQDRFGQAEGILSAAKAQFESVGSPFASRASLDLAAIQYVRGQADAALVSLASIRRVANDRRYAFNAARAAWLSGLVTLGLGRLGDAQGNYEDMLASFEAMQDAEGIANAHHLLAALHDYLGDARSAWTHRTEAFEGMAISRSHRFRYSLLQAAVPSLRAESPEAALSLQDSAAQIAQEWGRDGAIADALAQRASILASLNRLAEAETTVEAARQYLSRVPDESFRRRIEVAVLSTESDLARRTHPEAAVAAATRAIELVEERRDRLRIAQLNLRLAKANIVWGRTAAAQRALDQGLRAFEEERASNSDARPISALDESWQLFETAVHLALKTRDFERAFALSEVSRMRSPTEAARPNQPTLSALQASLRVDEAVINLNQFEDELAVWVIRRDAVNVVMRPLARNHAITLVARQQNEIARQLAVGSANDDLYNEILRPIAAFLGQTSRLIVVPDLTFENVSFAAFRNPRNGRYLAEDVTLRLSPSVGSYRAGFKTKQPAQAGTLIFSTSSNAALEDIGSATGATTVLSGTAATRERFFREATDRGVVHLAAPAVHNASFPLLSRFIVADDSGRRHSGVITGDEIARRTLPNTNLIVIEQPGPRSDRGEGTSSMARAFISAGVPAVIGTLPGADETATRDLMIAFHREVSKGMSAEQALHTVQRSAIQQNGRRLGAWSALVMYGSDR